tara:strand:- start:32346 stop:33164 length:819 start_codon:yes stop_codon:yes gene_type:complete
MANVIQIKRNSHSSTSAPSTSNITYGELGYNNNNGAGGKLYIGGKASDGSAQVEDIQANIIAAIPKADDDGSTFGVAAFDNADFDATNGVVSLATTSTAAELNILDGATLDTTELNKLDGVTATTAELNYVDTTAGTAVASKALVVDSNKDITGIRNVTTTGNVAVGGDLTVSGTTTTVNSTVVEVGDIAIALAKDNSGDVSDIGFYGKYVSSGTKYAGLFRDATDGVFKFYDSLTLEPNEGTGVVSVGSNGYSLGDLSTNLVSSNIDCGTF